MKCYLNLPKASWAWSHYISDLIPFRLQQFEFSCPLDLAGKIFWDFENLFHSEYLLVDEVLPWMKHLWGTLLWSSLEKANPVHAGSSKQAFLQSSRSTWSLKNPSTRHFRSFVTSQPSGLHHPFPTNSKLVSRTKIHVSIWKELIEYKSRKYSSWW